MLLFRMCIYSLIWRIYTVNNTYYCRQCTKFEFQLKVYICGRRKIERIEKTKKENASTLNGNELQDIYINMMTNR